jgi:hypothetical protein
MIKVEQLRRNYGRDCGAWSPVGVESVEVSLGHTRVAVTDATSTTRTAETSQATNGRRLQMRKLVAVTPGDSRWCDAGAGRTRGGSQRRFEDGGWSVTHLDEALGQAVGEGIENPFDPLLAR